MPITNNAGRDRQFAGMQRRYDNSEPPVVCDVCDRCRATWQVGEQGVEVFRGGRDVMFCDECYADIYGVDDEN